MPTAHLLFNPQAGRLSAPPLIQRAARVLESYGWQIEIKQTRSAAHAVKLARQAAREGQDALFVAGGDGSLEHAVKGLLGSQTALAVLPVGTANVWAQELGLPVPNIRNLLALETCARMLAQGDLRMMDVGLCNGIPFLLWAGVGLDAFIVHSLEPRRRWEKILGVSYYAARALLRAIEWHGLWLKVRNEDIFIDGHYLLAILSNIRLYAGGLAKLSPRARLDDGMMEFWLFKGRSLPDALHHVRNLWAGKHLQSDMTEQVTVRHLEIEADMPLYIQLDGEPIRGGYHLTLEVRPSALRILCPAQTSAALFGTPPLRTNMSTTTPGSPSSSPPEGLPEKSHG